MTISRPMLAILGLVLIGCGDGQGKIKGRLLENGQPVPVPGQAALMFWLIGADGSPDPNRAYAAHLHSDGSFELIASAGKVPPGTYLVSLNVNGPESREGIGKFKKAFSDTNSPLRREIKAGKNDLVIDFANPGP